MFALGMQSRADGDVHMLRLAGLYRCKISPTLTPLQCYRDHESFCFTRRLGDVSGADGRSVFRDPNEPARRAPGRAADSSRSRFGATAWQRYDRTFRQYMEIGKRPLDLRANSERSGYAIWSDGRELINRCFWSGEGNGGV